MNIFKKNIFYLPLLLLFACSKALVVSNTNTDNSFIPIQAEMDNETVTFIAPYKNQLDDKMNEIIGYCPEQLNEDDYQSPLGNFIIDLILHQSEKIYGKPIDMAVVTNGGLRTPIPQGNVTVGNIFELMPFNNELVVLELNGSSVLKMIQYGALRKNAVFSGVTYKIKNGQPEEIFIKGKPFNFDTSYTLAVSDYLAGGGDRMGFLTKSTATHQLGVLFRDAIINHIKALTANKKEIIGKTDNRVQILE